MNQSRTLTPELLDLLPAADPEAVRSRRDLRRVNWWMGQRPLAQQWIRSEIGSDLGSVLDIGSGDGDFAASLVTLGARPLRYRQLTMVDRQRIVAEGTTLRLRQSGCDSRLVQADVLEFLNSAPDEKFDLVTANLFLHHFEDAELSHLFRLVAAKTNSVFASEPTRRPVPRLACKLLGLIGCNRVTRHDAAVSVDAGFRGQELTALWPDHTRWRLRERDVGLFTHCFSAVKL